MVDKSILPFEIMSDNKGKITSGLKRVEVFLKPNKVDSVIQSIKI
ncbi:MAG TPA: hypothetical protein VFP49_04770 [Nitrososphaeraceae archaeon]|nr:hypothetical protein [Nitrososphaeraceae archaeon]